MVTPVHKIPGGYQYGNQKKYTGPDAKEKAIKQGVAIAYSEKRAGKTPDPIGKGGAKSHKKGK